MTPAQKILNAYEEASDGEWVDGVWVQDHAKQMAAAFRAAASLLRQSYENEEPVDQADDWLDSIATELDSPEQ